MRDRTYIGDGKHDTSSAEDDLDASNLEYTDVCNLLQEATQKTINKEAPSVRPFVPCIQTHKRPASKNKGHSKKSLFD